MVVKRISQRYCGHYTATAYQKEKIGNISHMNSALSFLAQIASYIQIAAMVRYIETTATLIEGGTPSLGDIMVG